MAKSASRRPLPVRLLSREDRIIADARLANADYSSQAITYIRLDSVETNATGTPALYTTAIPLPTTVDAYGKPQSLPTQAPAGGAAQKNTVAAAALALVGTALLSLLC